MKTLALFVTDISQVFGKEVQVRVHEINFQVRHRSKLGNESEINCP